MSVVVLIPAFIQDHSSLHRYVTLGVFVIRELYLVKDERKLEKSILIALISFMFGIQSFAFIRVLV